MPSSQRKVISKIIVAGDGAVGKTSIVNYLVGKPNIDVSMTAGLNIECATYELNGQKEIDTVLTFWDFGGQNQFRFFQKDFTKKATIVMFVFDLTRYSSLQNLPKEWFKMFDSQSDEIVKVLIGNKKDLPSSIKEEDIQKFAEKYNLPYFLVSAKTGENIEALQNFLSQQLKERIEAITQQIKEEAV
ncbi:MAG: Rab family GTPase [Candidatus Heimdallarchaeaceae archaeon]